MTREGQGIDPEETAFRPATTRWSEPHTDHDDGLLPPFVPGRARTAQKPPADTPGVDAAEDAAPADQATDDWSAPDIQPVEPVEAEAATAAPDSEEGEDEPFPFEMPWEDELEADEPEVDLAELEVDLAEPEDRVETTEPPVAERAGAYVDAPSFGGYDDAPVGEGPDAAAELAGRLEELAARLRAEGGASVAADMTSPDRFTSLLAGLVAGYLAGRGG